MVEILGAVALFAIPVVAGPLAIRVALASPRPESIWVRGFLTTWVLCVLLGVVLGLAVDVLSEALEGRVYMIPAFVAYGMVQFLVGGACALVVGVVCRRKARERNARAAAPEGQETER